ncbi:hypothetical protein CAOG_06820 [Capsaspora owczarzaki ATCC 30864]|uniref:hypothetical protein n=1 Tax=Capsaspora owczarzaki (strain ATCC 30864) TaxID=595528 RepID=UPI0001FE2BE3|nr:hypothetical protein CAOG_06820 [Capsaspora owczarzaki ATCC 30864]|eukprot:XP_004344441.1 hypothetical protein CAOG_06820 [Capsaspora owczarzaki ATCC 30864]
MAHWWAIVRRLLEANQITSIPANAFTGLTALTRLELSSNRITSISAFTDLTALTVLNLEANQITSIPANAFTGLTALVGMALSSNQITELPPSAFIGLSAMDNLDLSNNSISSISANTFTDLAALYFLDLSINLITSISSSAFSGLPGLGFLTLTENPFTTLPPGLFQGLPNGLYLSDFDSYMSPTNLTFGGNTVAPPSTYGSASYPYQCDTVCATCYASGSGACCGTNCLTCNSSNPCTQCYDGYGMMSGSCVPLASIASVASVASTQSASAASIASDISAASASVATVSSASIASQASASAASASSAWQTSAASAASNAPKGSGDASSLPIILGVIFGVLGLLLLVALVVALRRRRSPNALATTGSAIKLRESAPGSEPTYQAVDHSGTVSNVVNPTYSTLSATGDHALYEHVGSQPQGPTSSEQVYAEASVSASSATSGVDYADPSLPNASSVRVPSASSPTTYATVTSAPSEQTYEDVGSAPQAPVGLSEVQYSNAAVSGVEYADPSLPNASSVRVPPASSPTSYATVTVVPSTQNGNADYASIAN